MDLLLSLYKPQICVEKNENVPKYLSHCGSLTSLHTGQLISLFKSPRWNEPSSKCLSLKYVKLLHQSCTMPWEERVDTKICWEHIRFVLSIRIAIRQLYSSVQGSLVLYFYKCCSSLLLFLGCFSWSAYSQQIW